MLLISQSDGSRVSNFRRNLLIKISLSLKKNNLQGNNFSIDLIDNIVGNSIQYTVITHFSKKKHPIFGVPGIQQAKICPKVKSHNIDNIVYIYIFKY